VASIQIAPAPTPDAPIRVATSGMMGERDEAAVAAAPNRRVVLRAGLAAAAIWPSLGNLRAQSFDADPFALGVASGCPRPSSIVLWTRLLLDLDEAAARANPFAPADATSRGPLDVEWTIARNESLTQVVQSGIVTAVAAYAHSVHVVVDGLAPDRWYFYRFRCGNVVSPLGRTRTAPTIDAPTSRFRLATASCQQYEQGYYAAYRDMAARELDLVVHLGDYIYENSWGSGHVRKHGTGTPSLLFEYRDRYALYKSDPDLQAAHAAFPWLVTWDDHEVFDNYLLGGGAPGGSEAFLERRRAAYQAWFEHMPVPPQLAGDFSAMRIYGHYRFGQMLDLMMLDLRQYRTLPEGPSQPQADLLGPEQQAWLTSKLSRSDAHWTIVAQQTLLSERDLAEGSAERYSLDGWDGYRASRRHVTETIAQSPIRNPLVVGGDLHAFYAADVKSDFGRGDAPTVATEFVTGSITSYGPSEASVATALSENPHLRFASGTQHGYGILALGTSAAEVDFMSVSTTKRPEAPTTRAATFQVADRRPGVITG
jgi:alkaline phosphatase D